MELSPSRCGEAEEVVGAGRSIPVNLLREAIRRSEALLQMAVVVLQPTARLALNMLASAARLGRGCERTRK